MQRFYQKIDICIFPIGLIDSVIGVESVLLFNLCVCVCVCVCVWIINLLSWVNLSERLSTGLTV